MTLLLVIGRRVCGRLGFPRFNQAHFFLQRIGGGYYAQLTAEKSGIDTIIQDRMHIFYGLFLKMCCFISK